MILFGKLSSFVIVSASNELRDKSFLDSDAKLMSLKTKQLFETKNERKLCYCFLISKITIFHSNMGLVRRVERLK